MKDKEHSLLYHTLHSRPMPGCLPLFFLFSLIVTGGIIWLAPVEMPSPHAPKGVGKVHVKKDRLTDFMLRRQSPLPLYLPLHADPEYNEDLAAAAMPLLRQAQVLPPPPLPLFDSAVDSAVLDAADLLALPAPAEAADQSAQTVREGTSREEPDLPAAPVFHSGMEQEPDGEEVQP